MKSGSPPRGLSLKTVLESTADSVFVLDRDWRFAYLNPRAKAQIAGGRDLSGEVVWEAFPEARETAFWATYHKAMDEGVAASCEVFFRSLGAWFEANAYPIEGGIAVFFRDISQRRRAEEEREALLGRLEYEHTLLEAVVKQLPIGLIVAEAPGGKSSSTTRRRAPFSARPSRLCRRTRPCRRSGPTARPIPRRTSRSRGRSRAARRSSARRCSTGARTARSPI